MSLLDFRSAVANALIRAGKPIKMSTRKGGRHTLENAEQISPPLRCPSVNRVVASSSDIRLVILSNCLSTLKRKMQTIVATWLRHI